MSTAADFNKARQLFNQGYSASYIAGKTGLNPEQAKNVVQRQTTFNTSQAAPSSSSSSSSSSSPIGGGATTSVPTGGEFPWDKYANLQIDLTNLQGGFSTAAAQIGANAAVSSAGIRADADKEVAKAYADAQKYASGLSLEGVKYGADKESQWREAVANIEVKGKLDLQPIINAGLERVAGIEAQASRDVAETTGKYSLESMKERTAADKSIGKMQLAGGMYGLLGSIFG